MFAHLQSIVVNYPLLASLPRPNTSQVKGLTGLSGRGFEAVNFVDLASTVSSQEIILHFVLRFGP